MSSLPFNRVARLLGSYSQQLLALPLPVKSQAWDIRFKSGQPVAICGRDGIFFVRTQGGVSAGPAPDLLILNNSQMQELFVHICGHSVFSHEEEIRQGFVALGGFCRAGLCGTAVVEQGRLKGVRDVSSLVFRIPRDMPGCADKLFSSGIDPMGGVLVAGEPSSGKTTFLRDIARSLSWGRFGPKRRVAVLDCRGELGGGFDLGPCADVLTGYPKSQGFQVALRSLSPELILCDELSGDDLEAVKSAMLAGAALVASVHARPQDFFQRPLCRTLASTGGFGSLVCLKGRGSPGVVESVGPLEPWTQKEAG